MAGVFKPGNTAVITGGASGIGLALARRCAGEHGMRVLVADRDGEALLKVAAEEQQPALLTHEMDVSRYEDWQGSLAARVRDDLGGRVDLLVLNAGVGRPTSFADPDPAAFRAVLDTNVMGVVNGIAALLPAVKESGVASSASSGGGDGGGEVIKTSAVVITGSKQGITNPPGSPAYNASKAAVKSLAEHLDYDLRATPTSVHLLVPGWTWTPLAGSATLPTKPEAAWLPEQVAEFLEARVRAGSFWALCPDGEVTERLDRRRMLWTAGDAVRDRPPLSRWREEWKGAAADFVASEEGP